MTKLDGTARGGVVVAVHEAIDVPVKFLGVGESAADLVPFDAAAFASELLETTGSERVAADAGAARLCPRHAASPTSRASAPRAPSAAPARHRHGAAICSFTCRTATRTRAPIAPIKSLEPGMDGTIVGTVISKGVIPTRKGLRIFQAVLRDETE